MVLLGKLPIGLRLEGLFEGVVLAPPPMAHQPSSQIAVAVTMVPALEGPLVLS